MARDHPWETADKNLSDWLCFYLIFETVLMSWSPCLGLPRSRITGMYRHTQSEFLTLNREKKSFPKQSLLLHQWPATSLYYRRSPSQGPARMLRWTKRVQLNQLSLGAAWKHRWGWWQLPATASTFSSRASWAERALCLSEPGSRKTHLQTHPHLPQNLGASIPHPQRTDNENPLS